MNKTILLWGDTQVGKTAFLSSAFFAPKHQFDWLDEAQSQTALNATLFRHWQRLRKGLPVEPTAHELINLDLVLRDGGNLSVRDMQGGLTQKLDNISLIERVLDGVDAFLFLIEWNARNLEKQMVALEGVIGHCGDRPKGLAFTKCELDLEPYDAAWRGKPGWWRSAAHLSMYRQLLERFEENVWACSSFGYHADTGMPAVTIGEFAELIPIQINPKGTDLPLNHLFERLKDQ